VVWIQSQIIGRSRSHLLVVILTKKTPGSTLPFPDGTIKVNLFNRFFTPEVWDLLVSETNRYAEANLPCHSSKPRAQTWENVTVEEMKAFIGLLILMRILWLPRLDMYWQTSNVYIATYGISKVMSRVRFEQIYRFLYLANIDDKDDDPSIRDKLLKSESWQTCWWVAFKETMSHSKH